MRGRTFMLRAGVLAALCVLSGRMVWLQVVKAGQISADVAAMRVRHLPIEPIRGAIVDRNGRHLAVSVEQYAVIANALQIQERDVEKLLKELPPLMAMDAQQIKAKLAQNQGSGYIPLKDGLSLDQANAIEQKRLAGITVERRLQRTYPQGFTANQVVGYVDKDIKGQYGLEGRYDQQLAGQPGWIDAEFTYGKVPIEGTIRGQQAPIPGQNLVLSLDVALQQFAENKLDQVVKETKAKRALAMAMDVRTGEILMMAMRPGANPGDRSTWVGPNGELDYNRINNWGVTPLPPGSIFKTVTVSSAIETKRIQPNSTFMDSGHITVDGVRITNWDGYLPASPKPMSVAELLQHSSNVGLIQIGQQMKHEEFTKYLQLFGFMEPTGIDVSQENGATGLENFDQKRDIDWANMYIGQHLEATPAQMLRAVSAIANGGKLMQPHFVREIRNPDGSVVSVTPTQPVRQVISEKTATDVQKLMVSVVEEGTARIAKPDGYTVGGKTGTAQKFENGKMKDRMVADFVGFSPANDPKVAMLIVVDEPEGQGFGGVVAAPVFRDLLPQVMRSIGLGPDAPVTGKAPVAPRATSAPVPNVEWLPVARAQQRLEQSGFKVKLSGTGGLVSSQSIKAGTDTATGALVQVTAVAKGKDTDPVRVPDFSGLSLVEANQLAEEIGLILKTTGSGFAATQDQPVGSTVAARSILTVRLAPR